MATHNFDRDIPVYVCKAIGGTIDLTGYPMLYRTNEQLGASWHLRYGTPDQPAHIIEHGLGLDGHRRHLLLNAATRVSWLWKEPESQRLVPYRARDRLPAEASMRSPGSTRA